MGEPISARWSRRARTIPTMLMATMVAVAAIPLALPALAVADAARGRLRLPSVRAYLFALQYLINDSVEILLAPVYWLQAGFGTTLTSRSSRARHQRLQTWSMVLLRKRAEQLLGLRINVAEQDRANLTPGPAIVISRHVSVFDASLAGLVYEQSGYQIKGIIMAEMLADPGFDLIYGRLGSVFIHRDGGPDAIAAVERMTADADDRTVYVIFPEGRLFTPTVRDRALSRLADSDRARADRLAGLSHMLPPRPGGLLTLLAALPRADVVLLDHRGLDDYRNLGDLAKVAPVGDAIEIRVERFARSEIPTDTAEQIRWLDELWLGLDAEIAAERT